MIRQFFIPAILAASLCVSSDLLAAPPSLTPADIEKATGLRGVHLVAETTKGAVPGRSNYVDGGGQIVLWLHDVNAQGFARAKAQPAQKVSGIEIEPKLFHAAVAGVGDEAFDSPDGKLQYALYVRKGQSAFALIANLTTSARGDKPTVTLDQLKALAAIVLSRM